MAHPKSILVALIVSCGTLASLAVLSGCVASVATAADHPTDGHGVAATWQSFLEGRLRDDKAGITDAYGLFSEGGWSDAGQVMVLTDKDGKTAHLLVVQPGKKAPTIDRALDAAEWQKLLPLLKSSDQLPDFEEKGFDQLNFEFAHWTKSDAGKIAVADRLYVSNPAGKPLPKQDELIQALQGLRKAK